MHNEPLSVAAMCVCCEKEATSRINVAGSSGNFAHSLAVFATAKRDYVAGLNQPGNQPLPNHARGAGKKYSHTIIVGLASSMAPAVSLHL
jgi:hypothetical protein